MLNHIKKLLQGLSEAEQQKPQLDFNTALAALLVEVMRADGKIVQQELDKIALILEQECQLGAQQVSALIEQVKPLVEEAIDMFAFTKVINDNTNDLERIDVLELLWRVACADGEIDGQEDHTIRKISGLLYVTHADFIAAKHAAIDREK